MQTVEIYDTSDETLVLLYSEHHLRSKEIGELFGVGEDAIARRLRLLGTAKRPAGVKRADVHVHRNFQVSLRGSITKEALVDLLSQGLTKEDIAQRFLTSATTISRRMQEYGIEYRAADKGERVRTEDKDSLEADYLSLTREQFSSKYGCSRTVWLPILLERGIGRKSAREPDELTLDQKVLVLGSMLGDGSVSKGNTFYEYHCTEQLPYLQMKHSMLANVSRDVMKVAENGYRFETRPHPFFVYLHGLFYREGVPGKHIPVDLFRKYWDERLLAIWYLDDGHYDSKTDTVSIANKCPDRSQLEGLVALFEEHLHFRFSIRGTEQYVQGEDGGGTKRLYNVVPSKLYHREFFEIVCRFAPDSMLWKVPEEYLPGSVASSSEIGTNLLCKYPSLYRAREDPASKEEAVSALASEMVSSGFPYPYQTPARLEYLMKGFLDALPSFKTKASLSKGGLAILDHFFPSQFSAHRKGYSSPVDSWRSPEFVHAVARDLLDNSDASNTQDVLRSVRRLCRGAVTVQNPSLASYVYQNYNTNGQVLDTSSGYGSRLLAALSLGLSYDGYEPNPDTCAQLHNLGTWVQSKMPGGRFSVWCAGSETRRHGLNKYGLAFTSPPYFDFEVYSGDSGQSVTKHPLLAGWLTGYWESVLKNTSDGLIVGGYMVVNLSPRSGGDIIAYTGAVAPRHDMGVQDVVRVRYGGRHNGILKEEWLLVLRKGYKGTGMDLAGMVSSFRSEGARRNCRDKEELRDRAKSGGLDEKRIKDEMMAFASSGGNYSREHLGHLWSTSGYPLSEATWVIEEHYGKWSNFIKECGLAQNYELAPLEDQLADYLAMCRAKGACLSSYSYGQAKGDTDGSCKYSSRVKRWRRSFSGFGQLVQRLAGDETPIVTASMELASAIRGAATK